VGIEADCDGAWLLTEHGAAVAGAGDWQRCASPSRSKKLDGLSEWLRECFRRHAGNDDVVRQELAREKTITVSLRTWWSARWRRCGVS
jgi:hypothetical protein